MAVDQLPGGVREFAGCLDGLLARLDQGEGWSGVFWRRDPDGMRACLDGREVPPWDVVEALLEDLAGVYGPAVAAAERERARALHRAALIAYDALPGGRDLLVDRLDVMLREQRYAGERQTELTRLLSAPASPEDAESLRLDLAWAQDDHARATARCTELRGRLAELERRRVGDVVEVRRGGESGAEWAEGGEVGAAGSGVTGEAPLWFGGAGGVGRVVRRGGESGAEWAEGGEVGAAGSGVTGEAPLWFGGAGGVGRVVRRGGESGAAWAERGEVGAAGSGVTGEAPLRFGDAEGVGRAVRRGDSAGVSSRFEGADGDGRSAEREASARVSSRLLGADPDRYQDAGRDRAQRPAPSASGYTSPSASGRTSPSASGRTSPSASGRTSPSASGHASPRAESVGRSAAGPEPWPAGGVPAQTLHPLASDATPSPHAAPPSRRTTPAAAPQSAPPSPAAAPQAAASPAPAPGAVAPEVPAPSMPAKPRKRRRGSARFAGMTEDAGAAAVTPPQAPSPVTAEVTPRGARFAGAGQSAEPAAAPVEAVDAGAGSAVDGAVERLAWLRGEGRSGEAHVLLAEVAQWPPGRFPPLADALHRAGLGADWATLLWEAASLPTERLVGVADALGAAGRHADGAQLLRQGVARPAEQIGAAVLRLAEEGRRREADALLDACVRVRTAEEAAQSVVPDPRRLVPLLLRAAQAVSDERYWDLVHALRVAGHAT
ncbi:hypothetical protein AB5J72_39425 [Streptomyces sp. CG1]|uniref:hypothetical protein n=1 Tax=Streptomyces sp. CG1 TaxID=1287523 RepID=UPI0034E281B4